MVTMAAITQQAIRVRRNAASSSFSKSSASFWISSAASRRASAIGSMLFLDFACKSIYRERGRSAWLDSVAILFLAEIIIARVVRRPNFSGTDQAGLLTLESALGKSIASLLAFPDLSYPTSRPPTPPGGTRSGLVRDHRPARDLAGLSHEARGEDPPRRGGCGRPQRAVVAVRAATADQIFDKDATSMCNDL
jgi:hypothetical protein